MPQFSPSKTVLRVIGLRKEFRFYRRPWDRFLEFASIGSVTRGHLFVALNNVEFEVAKGDAVGVIGANGAGKSTLLKIICGTLYPTAGRVEVTGRVASLLELGTGFHPEFTGRQNIVFNARFLGLTDEEIHERMAAIVAFSELGDFIDRPLRTYSSGMQVRLAFAVMANVEPQILIIDEALAVGDAYFQQKCMRRIRQFREEGVSLLFVSHDPGAVKTLCSEAVLLHHGEIVDRGRPEAVLARYNALIASEGASREILSQEVGRASGADNPALHRSGSFVAIVEDVSLREAHGRECRSFGVGDEATISVRVLCLDEVTDPTVGILIRDRLGNDVYGTNTYHQEIQTGHFDVGEVLEITFSFALNIGPGEYNLTVAVHTLEVHVFDCFDWIDRLLVFRILPPVSGRFIGTAFLQPRLACRRAPQQVPERWEAALVHVFGRKFERDLTVATCAKPQLFAGWYSPEGVGDAAFCWTQARFSFLIDLRGHRLFLEVGTDDPGARGYPVHVAAWLFGEPLGTFDLNGMSAWSVCSLSISPSQRVAHGFVRMEVPGWCPASSGVNEDRRILGLRIRRIWVADEHVPSIGGAARE